MQDTYTNSYILRPSVQTKPCTEISEVLKQKYMKTNPAAIL